MWRGILKRNILPRSLWIGFLFALLSCISVIRPRTKVYPKSPIELLSARELSQRLKMHANPVQQAALGSMHRRWLGYSLGCTTDFPPLPLPDIDDMVVFCYGIPVIPWLKRVGIRQWKNWVDQLGVTLRARYPDREDIAIGPAWDIWIDRHVRYVETHFARLASQRIAQILSAMSSEQGEIYLFGHSAGGAAVLEYLADLRDAIVPTPARPIRAALTMNAAVAGPSRVWTAWPIAPERPSKVDRIIPKVRNYLTINGDRLHWHRQITWSRDYLGLPFKGLGSWAQSQGIPLLTVCNVADLFYHGALDDIPYMKLRIGRRSDIRGTITGKTHTSIQRDPRVPHFMWWSDQADAKV